MAKKTIYQIMVGSIDKNREGDAEQRGFDFDNLEKAREFFKEVVARESQDCQLGRWIRGRKIAVEVELLAIHQQLDDDGDLVGEDYETIDLVTLDIVTGERID